jgi:Ser/Thr protein kinase RdoA (MazF antagonist)
MLAAVRPFYELTPAGQVGRLRLLAIDALEQFALPPERSRCSLAGRSFNTVFRVDGPDGRRRALRVGSALRIHTDETELVEAAWITALGNDAVVPVPDVILAANASPVVCQGHRGVPEDRLCMMFGWITGRILSEAMTPRRAHELGSVAARLHEHAASAGSASGGGVASGDDGPPPVLVANQVLHWRIPNRLTELAESYGSLFDDALLRAQASLDDLWRHRRHRPHLLHGDLTPLNVMVSHNRLVPFDFQDLVWGFDIQDLAITLVSLRGYDNCHELTENFRTGYQDIRPWPDLEPELLAALIVARRLHQLNLTLAIRYPGFEHTIVRVAELVAGWLATEP